MSNECKTMREVYAIKEKLSEKIKDMTPEQQLEYFKGVDETMAELGIPLKRPEPEPAAK